MEKIIDIEDRIPTLKARRKRRTNTKFFTLFLLFFIILLVLLYFQSSYSNVKTLEVSGATLVDKTYYSEKSTITLGKSMWSFSEEEIEGILKQDDWVKDVTVKRNWLTGVEIIIEEWPKVAYIQEDGEYYSMLENGVVYPTVNDRELDAPIFLDFEDVNLRKRLVKELAKLQPEVLTLISHINAFPTENDPYAIRLYMNDGFEVRAVTSTLASKLNYYPDIVAQIPADEKGIIDLEVGSYYRSYVDEYSNIDLAIEDSQGLEVGQGVDKDEQTTSE